jgi:uncharacterized protein (TIGR02996 family)
MSPVEPSLLAAVLGCPEDDAPRLIYADWLEDQNQSARADFIRTQIKLYRVGEVALPSGHVAIRTGCPEDDALRRQLIQRERALFRRENIDLWSYVPWVPHDWTMTCHARLIGFRVSSREGQQDIWHWFGRGFVEEIELSAESLPYLDLILACQPVTSVRIQNWPAPPTNDPGLFLRGTAQQDWLDMVRRRWPGIRNWHSPEELVNREYRYRGFDLPYPLSATPRPD